MPSNTRRHPRALKSHVTQIWQDGKEWAKAEYKLASALGKKIAQEARASLGLAAVGLFFALAGVICMSQFIIFVMTAIIGNILWGSLVATILFLACAGICIFVAMKKTKSAWSTLKPMSGGPHVGDQ